ncbi:MAG: CinA family protein [Mailhella sp.]
MTGELNDIVTHMAKVLLERHLTCATAESCTGGLIGAMLTAMPGSSNWYLGGVISYANSVKETLLSVPKNALEDSGAVSEPVVRAMASGVCLSTGADASMSVSGIAGPSGGSAEKPVGTVWIGLCLAGETRAEKFHFSGDRTSVRMQAARQAMKNLTSWIEQTPMER